MADSWESLLSTLEASHEDLNIAFDNWLLRGGPGGPFTKKTLSGKAKSRSFIDLRKVHALKGSACIYKVPRPYSGLLYYDTIFVGIGPSRRAEFNKTHYFRWEELPALAERARSGQVIFYLTDPVQSYFRLKYLQPLFEEFRPRPIVNRSGLISEYDEDEIEFHNIVGAVTDEPATAAIIKKFAARNGILPDVADITICYTIGEIYRDGHQNLARSLVEMLRLEPKAAFPLIWTLRKVLVEPDRLAPGIPCAIERSQYWPVFRQIDMRLRDANVSRIQEVGGFIAERLSFPTPINWETLRWCEDNLDVAGVRRAFAALDRSAIGGTFNAYEADALTAKWNEQLRAAKRLKDRITWTSTMGLAVAGCLTPSPTTGLLAALGLAAVQNIWLDPLTAAVAKSINPTAMHIWNTKANLGR